MTNNEMYIASYNMTLAHICSYHIAGNFSTEKVLPISPPVLVGEIFILFCVNDYIADMVTFTALAKNLIFPQHKGS